MQKLCISLVPFKVPDGNGFREHAVERGDEFVVDADPVLAAFAFAVHRAECPELDIAGEFARNALDFFDAQHGVAQKRRDFHRFFFAEAVQHLFGDAFENSFGFDGVVRVVKI